MKERFQYPAEIQQIPYIRNDLKLLGDQWNIPSREFNQVCFIIEELFSNIVRYGYPDPDSHLVGVAIKMDPGAILIEISDDGVPFDPLQFRNVPSRDPAAAASGGMGLSLVRTFADSMTYRRLDDMNHLEVAVKMNTVKQ